jgi:proteic killer suppression protein
MTIQSFKCSDTQALFDGNRVARFRNIETVAMRKLAMLNRIVRVDELKIPPNNRLESLKGNRRGQWSIRINDQWRVCFCFENARALNVEIVDYH